MAGAVATGVLDGGERAPSSDSAEPGAAATKVLDDGERRARAAQPSPELLGCSMMASARHPATQPRPGWRRQNR